MNGRVTALGAVVLVAGFALLFLGNLLPSLPFTDVPLWIALLPLGIALMALGGSLPNPGRTTVRGFLGSPEENFLARSAESNAWPGFGSAAYVLDTHESVPCEHCHSYVPPGVVECPRCGGPRKCRACGRRMYLLAGGPRCVPCARNEVYCNCPHTAHAPPSSFISPRARGGM